MNEPAVTLGAVLSEAVERLDIAGSESARLDAELLLGHVLGVDRTSLLAHPEVLLSPGQRSSLAQLVERRALGEPVAYIRGLKEFYGLALHVDTRVLIPRPETETLVDVSLARIRHDLTSAPRPGEAPPYLVWDIGTGSGAIAIALASELRRRGYGHAVRFVLSDVSSDAVSVAIENAASHGVADVMTFSRGDLVDVHPSPERPIDLLVANLPYIPSDQIDGLPVAASYEPREALDGGSDGLDLVRRLFASLPRALGGGGRAMLEIGGDQAGRASGSASAALPGWRIAIHADLSGLPRVLELERPLG